MSKMNIDLDNLALNLSGKEFAEKIPEIEKEIEKCRKKDIEVKEVPIEFLLKIGRNGTTSLPCLDEIFEYYVFKTQNGVYVTFLYEGIDYDVSIRVTRNNPISLLRGEEKYKLEDLLNEDTFSDSPEWLESDYKNDVYSCLKIFRNSYLEENKNTFDLFEKYFKTMKYFILLYDSEFKELYKESLCY